MDNGGTLCNVRGYWSIIGCRMVAGAKGPRTGLGCPGWSQPDAEDKGPPKGMACAAGSQPVLNSSLGWSSTFSLGPSPPFIRTPSSTPLRLFHAALRFSLSPAPLPSPRRWWFVRFRASFFLRFHSTLRFFRQGDDRGREQRSQEHFLITSLLGFKYLSESRLQNFLEARKCIPLYYYILYNLIDRKCTDVNPFAMRNIFGRKFPGNGWAKQRARGGVVWGGNEFLERRIKRIVGGSKG